MGNETSNIAANERIALRIRDASIVSGLSRSTLYELLKAGKLRAVKIGGRRLILRDSLEALPGFRSEAQRAKRSGFERFFQARQARLGMAS